MTVGAANRLTRFIDELSRRTGRLVAWLTLAMVITTFTIVVFRYVFDSGYIWMQEAVTWLHAAVFMLGAAYALEQDQHVRVDVFYRDMTPRRQALVDITGVISLLLPLTIFFVWASWDYVAASWQIREGSKQASGLPYPATSLLKSMLLIMPALVGIQGLSLLLKAIEVFRGQTTAPPSKPTMHGGEL